jgi:hypothetical protein
VQPVQLARELRLVRRVTRLDDLAATFVASYRRVLELVPDQAFDKAMAAQQCGDLDERARARARALRRRSSAFA